MKGAAKKLQMTAGIVLVSLLLLAGIGLGSGSSMTPNLDIVTNLSESVERYRVQVSNLAPGYGMRDFIDLILCVMEVESHGEGSDPMQAAEGPFNKKYPKVPNGIQDPDYSIECGIQELKSVLDKAGAAGPQDLEKIRIALAGYNFGSGYIDWIQSHGGKWTLETAREFSSMMAVQMGWSGYGDPDYADKVMNYYENNSHLEGDGDFLAPMKTYMVTSDFGPRALAGYHYGIDLADSYGANIYAPSEGVVTAASSTCPPDGGYLGNMCPYNEYAGGGNYVMLKTAYKGDNYYIFLCHMKTAFVSNGQTVKKGQKIGEQGHSGNSNATHLHVEIHKGLTAIGTLNGIIDPSTIIKFN